jgi:hypothetical protein
MVVAAFLNFQYGPGMVVLRGDGQAFKGQVFRQRLHSAYGFSGFHDLFKQCKDFIPALGSQYQISPGGQQFFPPLLCHASADDQHCRRMLPPDFPDQLKGLFIACTWYGTGVDKVYISRFIHGDGMISGLLEELQHSLCIILVNFATQGMRCNGKHVYSISP